MKLSLFHPLMGLSMLLTLWSCRSQKSCEEDRPAWTNSLTFYSHSIATGGYGYVFQVTLEPDTLQEIFTFDSLGIAGIRLPVQVSKEKHGKALTLEAHYRYEEPRSPDEKQTQVRIGQEDILNDKEPKLYYHLKDQHFITGLNQAKVADATSPSP